MSDATRHPEDKPNKLKATVGNLNRKGRKPGAQNKVPKALKDMILGALDGAGDLIEAGAGGQAYLQKQASENPGPFLALVGKVLPSTINATLGNPDGSPLAITVNFVKAK